MTEPEAKKKPCSDFLQELSLYLDIEESPQLCEALEQHLAECMDCEIVVDTLKKTISLYRTLPQPAMPEGLRERLYHTFHLEAFLSSSGNEAE